MRTLPCIFLVMTIATAAYSQALAQDLPIPAKNPIPEEALKDAPSFGGSRPSDEPQPAADRRKASPEVANTDWKPKLSVKLRTRPPGDKVKELVARRQDGTLVAHYASVSNEDESNYAILKCDDVQVEVKTDDKGAPMYSFNCKGKAVVSVSGNTITADSITTVDGKLSASNAIIEMPNKTVVRSEKLSLELTIFEIEVKSAVDEISKPKEPVPDDTFKRVDNSAPAFFGPSEEISKPAF